MLLFSFPAKKKTKNCDCTLMRLTLSLCSCSALDFALDHPECVVTNISVCSMTDFASCVSSAYALQCRDEPKCAPYCVS
jgi:hypothetical protein